VCFFFFQAEDGIRDFHVTGVQTCALPISARTASKLMSAATISDRSTDRRTEPWSVSTGGCHGSWGRRLVHPASATAASSTTNNENGFLNVTRALPQIGRASCRERV